MGMCFFLLALFFFTGVILFSQLALTKLKIKKWSLIIWLDSVVEGGLSFLTACQLCTSQQNAHHRTKTHYPLDRRCDGLPHHVCKHHNDCIRLVSQNIELFGYRCQECTMPLDVDLPNTFFQYPCGHMRCEPLCSAAMKRHKTTSGTAWVANSSTCSSCQPNATHPHTVWTTKVALLANGRCVPEGLDVYNWGRVNEEESGGGDVGSGGGDGESAGVGDENVNGIVDENVDGGECPNWKMRNG